jgi:tetratricopeptide (TPR) repeat protein
MFQELLLADLVIADLSIDNANVFYELGVRHALRKRGLIHIQSGRGYLPFDIFNVRTLPYHCDENGQPDRQYLEKDKQAIAKMARATWESDHHRIHSPIFNLLDGLEEPDRRSLQTPLAIGYWDEYNNWRKRVVIAQRQDRIGDVLLLIEEVSNPLIKCEAIAEAGKALRNLGNYQLALQQYRNGLTMQPKNAEFRREEAFHLSRLKRYDEAVVQLESLLRDEPANIDAISYLARIYKEMWKERWVGISNEAECLQTAEESAHLLQKAIETYLQAYRLDQNHYYSGINALTLSAVFKYLARHGRDGDPEEKAIKEELPVLSGAVKFSLDSAALKDNNDVWVFLSLGDLAICTARNPQQVARAYKRALNRLWNNKFALLSTLEQLKLLESLNFRLEYVKSGLDVLEAELERIEHQEAAISSPTVKEPPQVFLFSGHMIDKPDRPRPRFPSDMETEAQQKIKEVLDKLQADTTDLAIMPGLACGGDILFLEACLERQMKVEVYLPFESAQFIEESVSFAGDDWVERFYRIKNHPQVALNLQPERIGPVPKGSNSFERNNRWALYSSLIYGIDRVRLIVLWDGKGGDGRGGTGDMVKQVRQLGGIVEHLDTTKFDYWKAQGAGIGNRET